MKDAVIDRILLKISTNSPNLRNAWDVLKIAAAEARGLDQPGLAIKPALMKLLAGPDNAFDTKDDLVSREVAEDIALFLQTQAFDDMVKFLSTIGPLQTIFKGVKRIFSCTS
jgi:hypothetical protein